MIPAPVMFLCWLICLLGIQYCFMCSIAYSLDENYSLMYANIATLVIFMLIVCWLMYVSERDVCSTGDVYIDNKDELLLTVLSFITVALVCIVIFKL